MRLWPRRKVYLDNLPKTHDLRFMLIFVLGLVLVFGALYGVGYAVAGNKLPAGTTVAGVDVGGVSPDQARTQLQSKLAPRLENPIKATVAGKTFSLDPQRTGLTFDIDATLDEATGGSPWDPRHMLHVLMGGGEVSPIVDVDNNALTSTLKRISDRVGRRPRDSTVSFTRSQATVSYGRAGRQLDYQRSGDRLVAALIAGQRSIGLAMQDVQPRVSGIRATRFVDTVARKALKGPVRIKIADGVVSLSPATFGPALRAVPSHGGLRLDIDAATLARRSKNLAQQLPHHPVDARIRFDGDHPVVVPGTSGVTVAPTGLAKAVLRAASRDHRRVARAKPIPDNPKVTTQDVRLMRIKERVAAVRVGYRRADTATAPNRQLRHLDGVLLKPGRSLSLLSKIPDPQSPAASLVASMAYDAAFYAGLEIPERTPARISTHGFAPGRDAHVEPPATDLVISNDTPYGVYVRTFVEQPRGTRSRQRVAHLEMWSTRYWKVRTHSSGRYNVTKPQVIKNTKKSCVPRAGVSGFDVNVTRLLIRSGHKRSEVTHSSYASLDQVRCTRKG